MEPIKRIFDCRLPIAEWISTTRSAALVQSGNRQSPIGNSLPAGRFPGCRHDGCDFRSLLNRKSPIAHRKFHGFSLIELLTVVAIIAILASLAIPAFQSIAMGSSLSRGGQILADQIVLARQLAVSRNSQVQVRLVRLTNEPAGYRAIQLAGQEMNSTNIVALTRVTLLPEGVALAPGLSPLLTNAATVTNGTLPGRGTFSGFRFKPAGGTDLPFDSTDAYLTVVQARDSGASALPNNYCIIQIDPVTGRTKTYRP